MGMSMGMGNGRWGMGMGSELLSEQTASSLSRIPVLIPISHSPFPFPISDSHLAFSPLSPVPRAPRLQFQYE